MKFQRLLEASGNEIIDHNSSSTKFEERTVTNNDQSSDKSARSSKTLRLYRKPQRNIIIFYSSEVEYPSRLHSIAIIGDRSKWNSVFNN